MNNDEFKPTLAMVKAGYYVMLYQGRVIAHINKDTITIKLGNQLVPKSNGYRIEYFVFNADGQMYYPEEYDLPKHIKNLKELNHTFAFNNYPGPFCVLQ